MAYSTILVHFGSEEHAKRLVDVAAVLGQRHNAHVIGLYVIPKREMHAAISVPVPSDVEAPVENTTL